MLSVSKASTTYLLRGNPPRCSIRARIVPGSLMGLGYWAASVSPVFSLRKPLRMREASATKMDQETWEPVEDCAIADDNLVTEIAEEFPEQIGPPESDSGHEEGLQSVKRTRVVDPFVGRYRLRGDCVLILSKGDITTWSIDGHSDAIVNAANEAMLGGGGVDGGQPSIEQLAGDSWRLAEKSRKSEKACDVRLGRPASPDGMDAMAMKLNEERGFLLPAAHVIHTVGPIYTQYPHPAPLLAAAYRSCLDLANANKLKYVCFPALSCGIYGYPFDDAAFVALTMAHIYGGNLNEIHFVLFDEPIWDVWRLKADKLFQSLQ